MKPLFLYTPETDSTNSLLISSVKKEELPEGYTIYTDFQTAGKGQIGNHWESERGKNLLFSTLLYPKHILMAKQFTLSEIASLALLKALNKLSNGFSIKWANDIYYKDKKIAGILIENSIQRDFIKHSVIGIGLNVNQETFSTNIPNPISLKNILHKEIDREKLLEEIHTNILALYSTYSAEELHQEYLENLYRKDTYYPYKDTATNQVFKAKIESVALDGKLTLSTKNNIQKSYYFKEVEFLFNKEN